MDIHLNADLFTYRKIPIKLQYLWKLFIYNIVTMYVVCFSVCMHDVCEPGNHLLYYFYIYIYIQFNWITLVYIKINVNNRISGL